MKDTIIREYTPNDQDKFKKFYIDIESKKRTNRVIRALKQRTVAKRTWQAGMVGILSIHLTQFLNLSITIKKTTLMIIEMLLWSAGIGVVWYKWICQEYNDELKRISERMATELSHIQNNGKSNAWMMERNGNIMGTVALKYEKGEGKIGYLTGLNSQIRLKLVQHAFRFGRVNKIEVISKWKDDLKWSENPFQHFGLSSFPSDVAFLNRLSMLNLSNNELTKLPPVINYLVNLTNLNLSNNLLTFVPEEVCKLKRLTQLNISFNPLIELPSSLVQLRSLETLDISKTNINFIPAELMTMMKIKININECIHLLDRSEKVYQLIVQNPFSLFETCARQIMYPILSDLLANKKNKKQIQRRKVKFTKRLQSLPKPMLNYLMNPNACSFCGGIYYQSYITRYRIIRYDHEIWIPIEYKLCSSHWKTNREFLLATFSNAADSSLPHSVHSLKSMLANAYNI
ncbi:uncharacterized protein BX663DRAFT_528691 [Cokeromyces recurvatus]|uniref:uncharacterized protein n=1 Tax=Cokeromyces recurvatus TaxID=90255 RepID=UPI00221EB677|nr:uncharacterized protein BX663DRAFT_528691 [Cokeromyces recurvatus]KAI7908197.1 hypothetical protein BX663DRAFT_528691 [Cokeromyces recurvatus]